MSRRKHHKKREQHSSNTPTIVVVVLVVILGVFAINFMGGEEANIPEKYAQITMYKSPTCGCCSGHASALQQAGYEVNLIQTEKLDDIKAEFGIPPSVHSCHTIVAGDYFIEGHIPVDAVTDFLNEEPDVDGIALPGMPTGTPGMPGPKRAPYRVFSVTDGQVDLYRTI